MKLYSKHQVVAVSVITGIAVFLVTFFSIFLINKKNYQKSDITNTAQVQQEKQKKLAITPNSSSLNSKPEQATEVSENLTGYTQEEAENIKVYEKCSPAVVNINTKVTGINWFLEPVVEDGGSGSGSIIDERGYVVTNVHVINNASKIYISLSDGTQYEGKVIGSDLDSDIAVLKFDPPKNTTLSTIPFGNSQNLKVGQKVIAIGNPFGLDRTMTTGIVSGLGRPIQNSSNRIIRNMIQTDTAINPGNSGGPLLDTAGRMIGINTMIYSSSGNSAGVGFAVPAATAQRVVADLIKYGTVNRGIIQASLVQLNSSIVRYANLDISRGVLISTVTRNGNADKAGLKAGTEAVRYGNTTINLGGDVITKINNITVASLADYYSALEDTRPGEKITVVIHRNKKNMNINLTLAKKGSTKKAQKSSDDFNYSSSSI